jgi:hypothetical protein
MVQALVSEEFLYALIGEVRRSPSRGVVSLSPEPGFYATMCLFFLLVQYLFGRMRSLGTLVCIAQITLLARSTLITAILLIAILVYAITHLSPRVSIAVTALIVAGWAISTQTSFFDQTRMGELAKLAAANPSSMTKVDPSISDRVGQLVFSLKGAGENYLLPNGFTSWGPYYHEQILQAGDYFRMYYGDPYPKRIQSGIGAPLYELGAIGLILPCVLLAGIKRSFGSLRNRAAILVAAVIGLSLLPGTPIATPIYGFLIGCLFAARPARFSSEPAGGPRGA